MSPTDFVILTIVAVMLGGSAVVATLGWVMFTINDQRRLKTLMEEDAREAVAPYEPHVEGPTPQRAPVNGSTWTDPA
jgi:hypothetical protein